MPQYLYMNQNTGKNGTLTLASMKDKLRKELIGPVTIKSAIDTLDKLLIGKYMYAGCYIIVHLKVEE